MAVRVFETLSAAGWQAVAPHKLANGDVVRVKDDTVQQFFAADQLNGDAGVYIVAQVQESVTVAVITAAGTREQSIAFTA